MFTQRNLTSAAQRLMRIRKTPPAALRAHGAKLIAPASSSVHKPKRPQRWSVPMLATGCCTIAITWLATPAPAEPALADPATGRLIRAEVPPQRFDQQHVRIELDLAAWPPDRIHAKAKLRMASIGTTRTLIELDAKGLDIHRVQIGGKDLPFEHTGSILSVRSPAPLLPGRTFEMVIDYTITDLEPNGLGMSLYDSDLGDGRKVLSSQGQTDHNSRWFPCRDMPDDSLTSEVIVTAPRGVQVLSNGVKGPPEFLADGRTVRGYSQDRPHPVYLVAVAMGEWITTDLADLEGGLPMQVFTEAPLSEADRAVLSKTGPMLRYFETVLDEPYPWAAYNQVYLPGVTWSMEHTSMSFMDADLLGNPAALEEVNAHEIAHQWVGNLVTCRDWSHLWLNEGLATYMELLWAEHDAQRSGGSVSDARARVLGDWRRAVLSQGAVGFPGRQAIVSNRFSEPDERFELADNPYSKGAYIVHMLRMQLGDGVFFRALALFIDRHRHGAVETADLRRAFEDASGLRLTQFFDQWTARAGFPVIRASGDIDATSLRLHIEQVQPVNADNPPYALRIPVVLTSTSGAVERVWVWVDTVQTEQVLPITFSGEQLEGWSLDPERSILMQIIGVDADPAHDPAALYDATSTHPVPSVTTLLNGSPAHEPEETDS